MYSNQHIFLHRRNNYKSLHPSTITEILHLYTTPVLARYIRSLQKEPIAGKYYISIDEYITEELCRQINHNNSETQSLYFFPVLQHEKYDNPITLLPKIVIVMKKIRY